MRWREGETLHIDEIHQFSNDWISVHGTGRVISPEGVRVTAYELNRMQETPWKSVGFFWEWWDYSSDDDYKTYVFTRKMCRCPECPHAVSGWGEACKRAPIRPAFRGGLCIECEGAKHNAV